MWRTLLFLALGVAHSVAGVGPSALAAMRVLDSESRSRIARVAACEGTPDPERWHFLLFAPQEENGLHDITVADGQVVARNRVSQFATSIQATDVIGSGPIRVDSDQAGLLARRLAAANSMPISALNYELRRDALGMAPVWKVTCINLYGAEAGWVVVDAGTGALIAHSGFSHIPPGLQRTLSDGDVEVRRAIPVSRRNSLGAVGRGGYSAY